MTCTRYHYIEVRNSFILFRIDLWDFKLSVSRCWHLIGAASSERFLLNPYAWCLRDVITLMWKISSSYMGPKVFSFGMFLGTFSVPSVFRYKWRFLNSSTKNDFTLICEIFALLLSKFTWIWLSLDWSDDLQCGKQKMKWK